MHQQFAPETPIYNESFHLTIHEAINADHIEDSLNKIVERHEILRARIVLNNGAPNQYFEPYQPFKLPRYDFRDRDIRDAECLALRLAQEDLKKCFKYGEEPLIRFYGFG